MMLISSRQLAVMILVNAKLPCERTHARGVSAHQRSTMLPSLRFGSEKNSNILARIFVRESLAARERVEFSLIDFLAQCLLWMSARAVMS